MAGVTRGPSDLDPVPIHQVSVYLEPGALYLTPPSGRRITTNRHLGVAVGLRLPGPADGTPSSRRSLASAATRTTIEVAPTRRPTASAPSGRACDLRCWPCSPCWPRSPGAAFWWSPRASPARVHSSQRPADPAGGRHDRRPARGRHAGAASGDRRRRRCRGRCPGRAWSSPLTPIGLARRPRSTPACGRRRGSRPRRAGGAAGRSWLGRRWPSRWATRATGQDALTAARRSSVVVDRVARAGVPTASTVTGIRLALESGRGRHRDAGPRGARRRDGRGGRHRLAYLRRQPRPSRPDSPTLQGWNWDVGIGDGAGPGLDGRIDRLLKGGPAIEDPSSGTIAVPEFGGGGPAFVMTWATQPARGVDHPDSDRRPGTNQAGRDPARRQDARGRRRPSRRPGGGPPGGRGGSPSKCPPHRVACGW